MARTLPVDVDVENEPFGEDDKRYNEKYCKNILKNHYALEKKLSSTVTAKNNDRPPRTLFYVVDNLRRLKYEFDRDNFCKFFSDRSIWKILSSGHCFALPMRGFHDDERDNDVLIFAWFDLDGTSSSPSLGDLNANVFIDAIGKLYETMGIDCDNPYAKWLVLQNEKTRNYHIYTNFLMKRLDWLMSCLLISNLLIGSDYDVDFAVENLSLPYSTKHDDYGIYDAVIIGNVDDVSQIFLNIL